MRSAPESFLKARWLAASPTSLAGSAPSGPGRRTGSSWSPRARSFCSRIPPTLSRSLPVDEEMARLLGNLPGPDQAAATAVRERASRVLRPLGALARLDEVATWLAGWQRTARPSVSRPAVMVFAADHGVAAERVSAYPVEVTSAMLRALQEGVATASVMAREVGARMRVVDVGVGRPSDNLSREPALSRSRFRECFEAGRQAVAEMDTDMLLLGE